MSQTTHSGWTCNQVMDYLDEDGYMTAHISKGEDRLVEAATNHATGETYEEWETDVVTDEVFVEPVGHLRIYVAERFVAEIHINPELIIELTDSADLAEEIEHCIAGGDDTVWHYVEDSINETTLEFEMEYTVVKE